MKTRLFPVMLFLMAIASCQQGERPPVRQAQMAVLQHFELPVYAGMVEVIDVKHVDDVYQTYYESDFFDILFQVTIHVKEGYKISRIFAHGAFDIDHTWPEIMQERLELAPDDDARQAIIDLYESRTFAAGEHKIMAAVTMARTDSDWLFLSLFLEPEDEMRDVLPKQMHEDQPPA